MRAWPAKNSRLRLRVGLTFVMAALLGATPSSARAEAPPSGEPSFYFFSPDWRPADLNALAERMHAALLDQAFEVSFQAFARYDDFSRQVVDFPPAFLIAPGWFPSLAANDIGLSLQPIATPLRHHRTTYRKALVTRSDVNSIADLARGSIAAAVHSLGPGSEQAVLDAVHLDRGSAKVIAVPKDVDGLLALSFGQVDAALVTAQQYELLASSTPDAAAKLQVLAFSAPIPLPGVFAGAQTSAEDRLRMAAALAKFTDSEAGREVLALLGYDAFATVAAAQPEQNTEQSPPAKTLAARAGKGPAPLQDVVKKGKKSRKKATQAHE